MRKLRLALAGTVMVVLLGASHGVVVAHSAGSEALAFPTGTFVSIENPDRGLEFGEDGTGRAFDPSMSAHLHYGVSGDLYTEMAFEYSGSKGEAPMTPGTYYWDWDGEQLTFELWGEDLRPSRKSFYTKNTFALMEDPRPVVVASWDIDVGEPVFGEVAYVPSAEAGPDALRWVYDIAGPRLAAVPITEGQPITPDMLAPAE